MARLEVVEVVEEFLAENWTALPVATINSNEGTPEDITSFVVVQYPFAEETQVTFGAPGDNIFREEGAVRFVLNLERGSGVRQGLAWAKQIAALFRGKDISGVVFGAPTSPVIDDRNEEGAYYSLAVAVPYKHDAVG